MYESISQREQAWEVMAMPGLKPQTLVAEHL